MTTYGSLSNAQFVTLLYANVLGRAPDQGGLDFWVSSLQGGALRERVVLSFSESAEFIQKTAQMLVGFMQMSVPTFADILDGGAGDDDLDGNDGDDALFGGAGADMMKRIAAPMLRDEDSGIRSMAAWTIVRVLGDEYDPGVEI